MKYLKVLGLAAIAAMALMAFVGAGSASATVLCKTNTTPCGEGWRYVKGTKIVMSLEGSAVLKMGFKELTCTKSAVESSTENEGGATETVHGPTSSFTLSTCNCEPITVTNGTLEVHWIEGTMNGTLTASGFTTHMPCAESTCNYITGNALDMGTITGSNVTGGAATIDIDATLTKQAGSSFLCAGTATWEAKYIVTSPNPLYIAGS